MKRYANFKQGLALLLEVVSECEIGALAQRSMQRVGISGKKSVD